MTTSSRIGKIVRWIAAPLPALVLVVVCLFLIVLGFKNIQIGGLLGKLFGVGKDSKKVVDTANTVPEERVDPQGRIIPPGTPDSEGQTQATVVSIEPPSVFSDQNQVEITPPGKTEPVVVPLPTGVEASDVDKVIVVTPEVHDVTVRDTSGVSPGRVNDLLEEYGK